MSQNATGLSRSQVEDSAAEAAFADGQADLVRSIYSGTLFPDDQLVTYRSIDRLFPTRLIRRGKSVRRLPPSGASLAGFRFESAGKTFDLYDFVSRNLVTGLLVLKDGETVFETYQLGNAPDTRWMSMSIAKSISTTLVGAAIKDGYIRSVDDPVVAYLRELEGSVYDGVSIKELMQMTSGAGWIETHTDPNSNRRRMLELQIERAPGTILRYMASLDRAAPPGTVWNYSTGETHVVGALLRAAVGRPLSQYLSDRIWSKAGMESDATWWLESQNGLEVAGSGISATLRDYGRFGLFMMEGGVIDGERILPEGWIAEACTARMVGGNQLDYGYMWWIVPAPPGHEPGFCARGNFGQRVYVNVGAGTVIVVWSARSKPIGAEQIADNDFFNAVVERLSK